MMRQYGLQMIQNLNDFLHDVEHKKYATQTGTDVHAKMRKVVVNENRFSGDTDIVKILKEHPELWRFFDKTARTEISIAGYVHGFFISRRIDRLLINHETRIIDFIDYKTDINKTEFMEKYEHQLNEYKELLKSLYPDYKINGYILWLKDWVLHKVV